MAAASPTTSSTMRQAHERSISSLPDHVIDIIAAQLVGGSRSNFTQSCKAFRAAANRQTVHTLDLYELCGWGDGSQEVPSRALQTTDTYPNITSIIFPSGWRHQLIRKLLHHAATTAKTWRQLAGASLHFHALSPTAGAALAELAPKLTHVTLSLDLAFEQICRQAWRIAALQQLPHLRSLTVEPDLRPEALQVLSGLSSLRQLQLVGSSHSSHPDASLRALAGITQLTSLRFHWQAGRTLTDARLLTALTNLQELQVWLSGGQELPPCSSKPLPGMLEALGSLGQLTQLQLLQGLYMSWDLRQIRHLTGLQQLQVLGLHDSVLSEDELALLAPCRALRDLRVDTLRLPAVRSSAAAPAAAAAAAAAAAGGPAVAGGAAANAAAAGDAAAGGPAAGTPWDWA